LVDLEDESLETFLVHAADDTVQWTNKTQSGKFLTESSRFL
jgi:hypothetical protein